MSGQVDCETQTKMCTINNINKSSENGVQPLAALTNTKENSIFFFFEAERAGMATAKACWSWQLNCPMKAAIISEKRCPSLRAKVDTN